MRNLTKKDLLALKQGIMSTGGMTGEECLQEMAEYILSLNETLEGLWRSVEDVICVDPDELESQALDGDESEKRILRLSQQELEKKWDAMEREYKL